MGNVSSDRRRSLLASKLRGDSFGIVDKPAARARFHLQIDIAVGPPHPRAALGKAGIARALYFTAKEQRVVIVRAAFIKKTEKTPTDEVDLALQRAKELKP
jgi:hypothetical protein